MKGFQSSYCTLEQYKYRLHVFIVCLLHFFNLHRLFFTMSFCYKVSLGVEFYNLTWLHWPPVVITIEHYTRSATDPYLVLNLPLVYWRIQVHNEVVHGRTQPLGQLGQSVQLLDFCGELCLSVCLYTLCDLLQQWFGGLDEANTGLSESFIWFCPLHSPIFLIRI